MDTPSTLLLVSLIAATVFTWLVLHRPVVR